MRFPLAAACAVFTLLAAAPAAVAGTLSKVDGTTYVYTGTVGEASTLAAADTGAALTFDEALDGILVNVGTSGCSGGGTAAATCPKAGITRIVLELGDRDDDVTVDFSVTLPVQAAGGTGDDEVTGGSGVDELDGGTGADVVNGAGGADEVHGGDGPDLITGGVGADRVFGDGGNDLLPVEDGGDVVSGGTGVDALVIDGGWPEAVPFSLDDVANDGFAPFFDVRSDVEQLVGDSVGDIARMDLVLTGNARPNTLRGGDGDDVIDGLGGADVLTGGDGADELRARDGAVDVVACGPGSDRATVDAGDVVEECERVDRAPAPWLDPPAPPAPVSEDAAPSVAFLAPVSDALLDPRRGNPIVVAASDDRGVDRVVLLDDGRPVGVDGTAPYTFDYAPTGDDVGRNTLVAVAYDGAGQTASAIRPLRLDRFSVRSRSLTVTPRRDVRGPYRFRATGRIGLVPSVSRRLGCGSGRVSVQVKRGARTVSSRRVALRADCSFRSTVTFRSRRRLGNGRLRVSARFLGNEVLRPASASTVLVRAG